MTNKMAAVVRANFNTLAKLFLRAHTYEGKYRTTFIFIVMNEHGNYFVSLQQSQITSELCRFQFLACGSNNLFTLVDFAGNSRQWRVSRIVLDSALPFIAKNLDIVALITVL